MIVRGVCKKHILRISLKIETEVKKIEHNAPSTLLLYVQIDSTSNYLNV